jgi:hypothetical protein
MDETVKDEQKELAFLGSSESSDYITKIGAFEVRKIS